MAKLTQEIEALKGDEAMGAMMAGLSAGAMPTVELAKAEVVPPAPVAKAARKKTAKAKKNEEAAGVFVV